MGVRRKKECYGNCILAYQVIDNDRCEHIERVICYEYDTTEDICSFMEEAVEKVKDMNPTIAFEYEKCRRVMGIHVSGFTVNTNCKPYYHEIGYEETSYCREKEEVRRRSWVIA